MLDPSGTQIDDSFIWDKVTMFIGSNCSHMVRTQRCVIGGVSDVMRLRDHNPGAFTWWSDLVLHPSTSEQTTDSQMATTASNVPTIAVNIPTTRLAFRFNWNKQNKCRKTSDAWGSMGVRGGSRFMGSSMMVRWSYRYPRRSMSLTKIWSIRSMGESIQLVGGFIGLVGGFIQLVGGFIWLTGGSIQLVGGSIQLVGGFIWLVGGSIQLVGGSIQVVGGFIWLTGGSIQLVGGSIQLVGGFIWLTGGSIQLVGGSIQLVGGFIWLTGGSIQLVGGSIQLVGGFIWLVDGSIQPVHSAWNRLTVRWKLTLMNPILTGMKSSSIDRNKNDTLSCNCSIPSI